MAALYGTPEYRPTLFQKIWSAIAKRAPYYVGRFIQMLMYGIFQAARFIIQMFKDAIG